MQMEIHSRWTSCHISQAAIEAEKEEIEKRKIKARHEMEKMLAANRNLHEIRAECISEERAVRSSEYLACTNGFVRRPSPLPNRFRVSTFKGVLFISTAMQH